MTDFAQAFQNDHNISDAVERDQSAAIVKLSRHIAQSLFAKCVSISH